MIQVKSIIDELDVHGRARQYVGDNGWRGLVLRDPWRRGKLFGWCCSWSIASVP